MLKEEKGFLNRLKEEFKNNPDIADILIFGSAARTNFEKYNDIDVLIVTKNPSNIMDELRKKLDANYISNENFESDYWAGFSKKIRNKSKYHIFYISINEFNRGLHKRLSPVISLMNNQYYS